LGNNSIVDISPLVANSGLSEGDTVYLRGNPLSDTSLNEYIPQLEERGVKVIELDPNDAQAYNNRGNAYYRLGEYDKAITDYTKAIDIDPNDAKAYYNRGNAYSIQSKDVEAINDFEKTISISNDPQLIADARESIERLSN